jgi:hypothetical protein
MVRGIFRNSRMRKPQGLSPEDIGDKEGRGSRNGSRREKHPLRPDPMSPFCHPLKEHSDP